MTQKRLIASLIIILLWLHGHTASAGQGCCSMHGGVGGCVGAKLQCNDGTLSPTCGCRDASNSIPSNLGVQANLALLGVTPQEAKPYITPTTQPGSPSSVDVAPPLQGNKPYITPAAQPEPTAQGDAFPIQKPPEPFETPIDNSSKGSSYHTSDAPAAEPTVGGESNQRGADQAPTQNSGQNPEPEPEEASKRSTAGNMQKQVERGQAPKAIDRVDHARRPYEKDQVHFRDGSALNKDGTWKHGSRSLTKSEKEWLVQNGWTLPK